MWGNHDFNGKIESGLRRLHRLAATRVAPMRKGTLTAGLEVVLNLKPLTLIIRERGLATKKWKFMWRWRPCRRLICG